MRLEFQVKPVPKPRMTRRDKWKKRPIVVAYHQYKDLLNMQANLYDYHLTPELNMDFHISMPESWSKKKKLEMVGKKHQQRPDLDNLVKAFQDALSDEDGYVAVYKNVGKYWSLEDKIIVYEKEEDRKTTNGDTVGKV